MSKQVDVASDQLQTGDAHYRAFVGPPDRYDVVGAMQFCIFSAFGLREHHKFLDIGCGSLRAGRFFLMYLQPGHYFGIEPEAWLIEEGITNEVGRELFDRTRPQFDHNADFNLQVFGETFDYINAQSIFTHAAHQQITACLRQVKQVLNPQGVFLATFIRGQQTYTGEEWVYPSVVTYRLEDMQQMVRDAGLESRVLPWRHANTHNKNHIWLVIFHPENEQALPQVVHRVIYPQDRLWPRVKRKMQRVSAAVRSRFRG